jgi:hypothetical protein
LLYCIFNYLVIYILFPGEKFQKSLSTSSV